MIVGLLGKKQSGKSTACDFIAAMNGVFYNEINDFIVKDDGQIIYNGNQPFHTSILNSVGVYGFADPLKWIGIEIFGIDRDDLYGTDEQKNKETPFVWSDLPKEIAKKYGKKDELITIRELMQVIGTDLFRRLSPDIWANACIRRIKEEGRNLSLVPDVRFDNEAKAIKDAGGYVIKLTRSISDDDRHASELSVDKVPPEYIDSVLDNSSLSIHNKNKKLYEILFSIGVFKVPVDEL